MAEDPESLRTLMLRNRKAIPQYTEANRRFLHELGQREGQEHPASHFRLPEQAIRRAEHAEAHGAGSGVGARLELQCERTLPAHRPAYGHRRIGPSPTKHLTEVLLDRIPAASE